MDSIIKSFKLQKQLNPKIWEHADTDNFELIKLRPDVRSHLLKIAKDFVDSFKIEDLEIEDVMFVGSLANYNWSNYSDVDLHVIIDKSKLGESQDLIDEFFEAKKEIFNLKRDIKIKGYDVELYAQDVNEELDSVGQYSVLYNKWVGEPERENFTLDKHTILTKVKEFNRYLATLEKLPDNKRKEGLIDLFKEKIRNYRKGGLQQGGELSNENLVFKYLRRSGFMERLSNLKIKTKDAILSLENAEL